MDFTRIMRRAAGLIVLVVALVVPGTAMARDRDHDHMRDGWEKKHSLSVRKANGHRDADRDGLSNLGEFRAHTDPQDPDSDDDCVGDDNEDADHDGVDNDDEMGEHTNPRNPDSNDDGTDDGDEDADHDGVSNKDDEDGDVEDQNDDQQCQTGSQGDDEQGDDGDDD
jgi:hypothetical protein